MCSFAPLSLCSVTPVLLSSCTINPKSLTLHPNLRRRSGMALAGGAVAGLAVGMVVAEGMDGGGGMWGGGGAAEAASGGGGGGWFGGGGGGGGDGGQFHLRLDLKRGLYRA